MFLRGTVSELVPDKWGLDKSCPDQKILCGGTRFSKYVPALLRGAPCTVSELLVHVREHSRWCPVLVQPPQIWRCSRRGSSVEHHALTFVPEPRSAGVRNSCPDQNSSCKGTFCSRGGTSIFTCMFRFRPWVCTGTLLSLDQLLMSICIHSFYYSRLHSYFILFLYWNITSGTYRSMNHHTIMVMCSTTDTAAQKQDIF